MFSTQPRTKNTRGVPRYQAFVPLRGGSRQSTPVGTIKTIKAMSALLEDQEHEGYYRRSRRRNDNFQDRGGNLNNNNPNFRSYRGNFNNNNNNSNQNYNNNDNNNRPQNQYNNPVSYTHLDVYKRQV